jgi:hypothetical protein
MYSTISTSVKDNALPIKYAIGTLAAGFVTYKSVRLIIHVHQNGYEIANRIRTTIGVNRYSRLTNWLSSDVYTDLRQTFKDNVFEDGVVHNRPKNHSHPDAAIYRCRANIAMSSLATMLGMRLYSVSMSASEQFSAVAGTRLYHHAKDLQMLPQHDALGPRDLIKMTDVDYYVHLPDYLKGNYVVLYTFVPTAVAGSTADAAYRVTPNNQVETHVVGGGHYVHPLWDYETDHLIVDHWWGSVIYLVEQRNITEDRRLIFLNPVRKIYGPFGWIYPGNRPRHRRLVYDNVAYVKSLNKVGDRHVVTHSFSLVHDNTCALIDDKLLVSIKGRMLHMTKPTMSDIERILRSDKLDDAPTLAAILYQVMINPVLCDLVYFNPHYPITKIPKSDTSYTPLGPLALEDGTSAMRTVGPMYALDGVHPKRGYNSDVSCLQGRIIDTKNPVTSVPPFYHACVDEFLKFMIPDDVAGTLVPTNYDHIFEQWKRPTQRSLMDKVKHTLFMDKPWAVKAFQKAEAYAKITHPRNISTLPTGHNVRYGQFSYAFSEHVMKRQHWYAFGKTPNVVSKELHAKARVSQTASPTDINRLDGSCGFFHQKIVKGAALRAFALEYHRELAKLIDQEGEAKGFTSFNVFYLALFNTLSGSSATSWRNSTITACLCYIAYRISGRPPVDAYAALGMYGGDDGVSFDLDPAILSRVFAKTGLILKADLLQAGSAVPFLGRYYIDPWTVSDSIADVPRQLRKLHLSASPAAVPNHIALRRKAEGFLVTDPMTPVLSHWARAILRVTPHDELSEQRYAHLTAVDMSYWAKYDNPFPPSADLDRVSDVVAESLGGHLSVIALCAKFDAAQTMEDLDFGLILEDTPKVQIPATFKGQVLIPNPGPSVKQQLKTNARPNKSKPAAVVPPGKKGPLKPVTKPNNTAVPNNKCRFFLKNKPCTRTDCKFEHA